MRQPFSYLPFAVLAVMLSACGGAPASILAEPPPADDAGPVDSATPGDTGTAPQDTGTVPDAEPDTAPPPPSCTFVVEPGATPCFWTTFFQVLPATCVSSGESVQAECATLCGTNANGETPDRCYVGSGASVDCYVDDECGDPGGPGGPGGPGPGGP